MADEVDPRTEPAERDVRPVVARPGGGVPPWMFAAGLLAFAVILFAVLNAHREALEAPSVAPRTSDAASTPPAPPPLYVPPVPAPAAVVPVPVAPSSPAPAPLPPPPPPAPAPIVQQPQPAPVAVAPPPQPLPANTAPVLVVDTTAGTTGAPAGTTAGGGEAAAPATVHASMLADKATTVIEGTLIPAVLESALDTSRPGPARALVTKDVRGWDGTRVLVPRGTRLFGEYRSDVAPGQSRVQILWTRLIRPDGATVTLASPAGDPLGRVGIKGHVDSHFFARFGAAILQTGLDIGGNLASRIGGDSVIVAVPGSVINAPAATALTGTANRVTPTIRVPEGTSITVFVAHDLNFTGVEVSR